MTGDTQDRKIALFQEHGVHIHENIKFVPVDFETDDLIQSLINCAYDRSKASLFLWEGVTFYLTEKTVEKTLRLIKENSKTGSRICFDFQTKINNELIDTGLKDESIKFGIEHGRVKEFVEKNGYKIVEHVSSIEMEKRFLQMKNGDTFGAIAPIMNFTLIEHA